MPWSSICASTPACWAASGEVLADGGFTDWTQQLLGNRKERLLISGIGLERLAGALSHGP